MSAPSSISSRRTFWPVGAGLVRDELHAEDLARRARAPRRSSCASLTPPPLPRPPAWICAFTTQTGPPSCFAARTASSTRERRNAARHRRCRTGGTFPCPGTRGSSRRPPACRRRQAGAAIPLRIVAAHGLGRASRARGSGRAGTACRRPRPRGARPANICTAAVGRYRRSSVRCVQPRDAAERVVQALAESLDEVRADELASTRARSRSQPPG